MDETVILLCMINLLCMHFVERLSEAELIAIIMIFFHPIIADAYRN